MLNKTRIIYVVFVKCLIFLLLGFVAIVYVIIVAIIFLRTKKNVQLVDLNGTI